MVFKQLRPSTRGLALTRTLVTVLLMVKNFYVRVIWPAGATLLLSYERDQRKKGNAISAAAFSLATLRSFLFFRFRQLVFTPLIRISHENAAATIEASCRETSKCKVFRPFYCSSLANPAAPATGFPLRSNKLRGMRSL